MLIEDLVECRVWAPHARFEHVDKPFFVTTDFPWQYGSSMWEESGGTVSDAELQTVIPEPVRVPSHFLCTGGWGWGGAASVAGAFNLLQSIGRYYQNARHPVTALADLPVPSLSWDLSASARRFKWAIGSERPTGLGQAPMPPYPNLTGVALGIDFCPAWLDLPNARGLNALWGRSESFSCQGIVLEIGALFPLDTISANGRGYVWPTESNPPAPLLPAPGEDPAADRQAYAAVGVSVGEEDDERVYGVVLRGNGDAAIVRWDAREDRWVLLRTVANAATIRMQREQTQLYGVEGSGTGWPSNYDPTGHPLKRGPEDVPIGGSLTTYDPSFYMRPVAVEFRLMGERMQIRIGDTEEAYSFVEDRVDADGQALWTMNRAHLAGERLMNAHLSGKFVGFRSSSFVASPPIPVGFYNDRWLPPEVDTAGHVPDGWTVEVDEENSELSGPDVRYRLVMNGPVDGKWNQIEYSWWAPGVRAVNMVWMPQTTGYPAPPAFALPELVRVSHRFDPTTLQAGSEAQLSFNNNRPVRLPSGEIGFWGDWSLAYGQVGLEVWATRTSLPLGGAFGPPTRLGTFYGHAEGETAGAMGDSRFTMRCVDRRVQLASPRWNLAWMDGWNAFYALGYLAQLGGVSPLDWAFAHLVPPAPFGEGTDLGDGLGGRAPYLPVGDAGSIVTRFSGQGLWDSMSKIAQFLGYMLFFDANGRLHFRPFRLASGSVRRFAESDRQSSGAEGCWDLRVRKDHASVRSDAITVGIDAFAGKWSPIVFKHSDEGVIYDPRGFNHLGYANPAVWVDSAFASEAFAYAASLEQINVLRTPELSARFTTWLQPDVFPLDAVTVRADRFGLHEQRLMVVGVDHNLSSDEPASTTITAQFVPEPLF